MPDGVGATVVNDGVADFSPRLQICAIHAHPAEFDMTIPLYGNVQPLAEQVRQATAMAARPSLLP